MVGDLQWCSLAQPQQVNEIVDDKTLIKRYQREIDQLRRLLEGTGQLELEQEAARRLRSLADAKERAEQEKEEMLRKLSSMERFLLHGQHAKGIQMHPLLMGNQHAAHKQELFRRRSNSFHLYAILFSPLPHCD